MSEIYLKDKCSCGSDISHKRVNLCSSCYSDKRKQDWIANEHLRLARDPDRKSKISKLKSDKYQKLKDTKTFFSKKCMCGEDALKGSKHAFCRSCSILNRKSKKLNIRLQERRITLQPK